MNRRSNRAKQDSKFGEESIHPRPKHLEAHGLDTVSNQSHLFDLAHDAFILRDLDGVIKLWNRAAEQIYGWRRAEAQGRVVYELLKSEFFEPRQEVERRVIEHGVWDGMIRHTARSGERLVVTSRWALQRHSSGAPVGILEINRDITKQTQAEKKAADRAELLDLAHDAIIVRDLGNKIVFWNRGAELTYGWTPAQAQGQVTHDFLRTAFPQPLETLNERLFSHGSWEGELEHVTRDGKRIIVTSRQVLQRDEHGSAIGILEINRDITGRRLAEESLQRLSGRLLQLQDEERRRIARDLHDSTGQTLAAIIMHTSALGARISTGPSAQTVAAISELAQQAATEIRTITYLLHPPELDMSGLASAIQWFVHGFSLRSKVEVALDIDPNLGRLPQSIETTVFRMVQEALSNVFRHSESPVATVHISQTGQTLALKVIDKGRGMSPHILTALKTKGKDLGVGILGMEERVRQFGGTFQVLSGDGGTTITATFPMPAPESAARAE